MFSANLLKAKMTEQSITPLMLCGELGICETTFYRKISRNGDFSRFEIGKISDCLRLTSEERNNIFFA